MILVPADGRIIQRTHVKDLHSGQSAGGLRIFTPGKTSWKKFPNPAFHLKIKRVWQAPAPARHLLRHCSLSRQASLLRERHRNKTGIALRDLIHSDNWRPRTL